MRHGTQVAGSEEVSEAQLEYEEEQRSESERNKQRRAEKPAATEAKETPAEEPDSSAMALAEHAREAAEFYEKIGRSLPIRPERYAARLLEIWGLEAGEIPVGGFMAHLRKHGVGPDPSASADSGRFQ